MAETKQEIVKEIDAIECEMNTLYRRLERLRLVLQEQWRVLPSGESWTVAKHETTRYT